MGKVMFIRAELTRVTDAYRKIDDCIGGADRVKKAGTKYLPNPDPLNTSPEATQRYKDYLLRAVFYAVAQRTLNGLTGQVFQREPVSEIPNQLDKIELDATGSGVTLRQLAKRNLALNITKGRAGVMVDYPDVETATVADLQSGRIRPTIHVFEPQHVINWRTFADGALTKFSLVVIAEQWPFQDDGFEIKYACQFRVLELTEDNRYRVTIWRELDKPTVWNGESQISDKLEFKPFEEYYPTGPSGEPIEEIPFMFTGPENNDASVDLPPFSPLVELNLAHYRNSADYEEACFTMGQPTFYASGLTEAWYNDVLKGEIRFGSRGGIPLPQGAQVGLVQMNANSEPFNAMEHKERQMVALGAKLVEQKSVQRTATEATQDEASETSFLASAADNTSSAMEWALKWCAYFMGLNGSREDIQLAYKLNTNFTMLNLSASDRAELIKEWQSGAITFSEMRAVLRQGGVATEDDQTAITELEQEQARQLAQETARMEAEAKTLGSNVGNGGNNA